MRGVSELGLSKEHRDLNIQRIGYVASEITKNGGVAIYAPIAPYAATRRKVREMIKPVGGFFKVHVSTPIEVCEQRDRKGLYVKARTFVCRRIRDMLTMFVPNGKTTRKPHPRTR